jgi:hypothetical protein
MKVILLNYLITFLENFPNTDISLVLINDHSLLIVIDIIKLPLDAIFIINGLFLYQIVNNIICAYIFYNHEND